MTVLARNLYSGEVVTILERTPEYVTFRWHGNRQPVTITRTAFDYYYGEVKGTFQMPTATLAKPATKAARPAQKTKAAAKTAATKTTPKTAKPRPVRQAPQEQSTAQVLKQRATKAVKTAQAATKAAPKPAARKAAAATPKPEKQAPGLARIHTLNTLFRIPPTFKQPRPWRYVRPGHDDEGVHTIAGFKVFNFHIVVDESEPDATPGLPAERKRLGLKKGQQIVGTGEIKKYGELTPPGSGAVTRQRKAKAQFQEAFEEEPATVTKAAAKPAKAPAKPAVTKAAAKPAKPVKTAVRAGNGASKPPKPSQLSEALGDEEPAAKPATKTGTGVKAPASLAALLD